MGAELDLSTLDEKEAAKVRKLAEPLGSMQPSKPKSELGGDIRQVVIAVSDGEKRTEVRFSETGVPAEVAPLLEYLRKQTKVIKPNK
ncbi:protealysin inhibitor emfourin [Rhizobium leguminosarum]|uniref:protealysin inhibitor emfourin n=1 Tax=Rhizobium leguminosarum TaxID=384 RepID=UPI0012379B71|nr:protealysin inhibitor emfourin [Rhizobium leguminosarum]